jgi:hypothetical protein
MKSRIVLTGLFTIVFFTSCLSLLAQEKGNKNIVQKEFDVESFDELRIGGAFDATVEMGESQKVIIETDENLMDKMKVEVTDGELYISTKGVRKSTKLNAYITVTELEKITASGASDIDSKGVIKADMFEIKASGASDLKLQIDVTTLRTRISGASTVILSGKADNHSITAGGASTLRAFELETLKTDADVGGASTVKVHAKEELTGEVTGASDIIYKEEPPKFSIYKRTGTASSGEGRDWDDTTRVNVGGIDIEVIEGDSVKVRVGNKELIVDEDGQVRFKRRYKRKYNGHWAGFDLGFNGYVDDNFTMDFAPEIEYMDLRMEKSVIVNINFFEQNFAFTKDQRFGATTGLGISLPNYRFRRSTHLKSDSSFLIGYLAEGISVRKTKLSMFYLTIPVLFEYQTNSWHKKNSFHVGGGIIMAARIWSWTKIYYNEQNKDFLLTRYNPETGVYEPELGATSPGRPKVHNGDDWFLRPVKFDATVRIGWGWINLWATFSLNSMFRANKGPEVYPWSAGITLINF